MQHSHLTRLAPLYSLATIAPKHSPKIIAAIETLAQAGKTSTEIREALLGGVPGLKPVPPELVPPKSTILYHARRARREMEPVPDLADFTNILEQQTIRIIKRDVKRINRMAEPSERDFRLLRSHNETLAAIRARGVKPSPQQKGKGKRDAPANVLDAIGSAIAERDTNGDVDSDSNDSQHNSSSATVDSTTVD